MSKNTIGFLHCLPALAFEGGVSIMEFSQSIPCNVPYWVFSCL
jgi:hypothetical protein